MSKKFGLLYPHEDPLRRAIGAMAPYKARDGVCEILSFDTVEDAKAFARSVKLSEISRSMVTCAPSSEPVFEFGGDLDGVCVVKA